VAGKFVTEDGVEDGGIVELDGMSKALFEIGDGLTVKLLVGLKVILLRGSDGNQREEHKGKQGQLFHHFDSGLGMASGLHETTGIE